MSKNKKSTATFKREPIPKKLRFEILSRDNFTCRYCGQSAPDVVLHADHIKPVAKGGTNDPSNLVAACSACNGGKSDRCIIIEPRPNTDTLGACFDEIRSMSSKYDLYIEDMLVSILSFILDQTL